MLSITQNKKNIPFDYTIKVKSNKTFNKTEKRDAVRGISLKGNKICVVYTDDYLYGTPGGGVEQSETLETALKRELLEEVGAQSFNKITYIGKINEERPGMNNDTLFNPTMHYYLVDIKEHGQQQLIEYEKELNLRYDYIDINKVIKNNEEILQKTNKAYSWFYEFQTELFKIIKTQYNL